MSAGNSTTSSIRSFRSTSSRPLSPKEKAEAKVAILQKLDQLGDYLASMSPTQETTPSLLQDSMIATSEDDVSNEIAKDTANEQVLESESNLTSTVLVDLQTSPIDETIVDSSTLKLVDRIDEQHDRNDILNEPLDVTETLTETVNIGQSNETNEQSIINAMDSIEKEKEQEIEVVEEEEEEVEQQREIKVEQETEEIEEKVNENNGEDDFGNFGDFGDFATSKITTNTSNEVNGNNNKDEEDEFGDFGDFGDFEDQDGFSSLNEATDESAFAPITMTDCSSSVVSNDNIPTSTTITSQPMSWIDITKATLDELSDHLADYLSFTRSVPTDDADDADNVALNMQITDTFDSLMQSVDMPWDELIAPWDESQVFQWRRSDTRGQFLTSLGLSDSGIEDTPTNLSRSVSPALSQLRSTTITAVPLKKPSLSTGSGYNARNARKSKTSSSSGIDGARTFDSIGLSGSAATQFNEARAQQLVGMHPDTLRSLSGPALIEIREELSKLEKSAVLELHRILDAREQALIDAELLNKSIEVLVNQAQKRKENETARRRKAASSGGFKERFSRIAGIRRTPTPESSANH
ncbi:hypothetical protein BDF19DRAFT_448333 [Syncephalis fuscata]|nr:hypothetical protein BDF19DRAFT_448333 [Syncephalis fuscata]